MSTPSLNNGLFMRDNSYVATSHVDSYHLMNLMKDSKPDDLGPIDMWAQLQKVEMPLYQMSSFNGKNVIDVEHPRGEFTLVVEGKTKEKPEVDEQIEAELREFRRQGVGAREAVARLAESSGVSRKKLYKAWLELAEGD